MSTITPLEERLKNQECRNWIKVCHALTILKEGMGEFCNTFKTIYIQTSLAIHKQKGCSFNAHWVAAESRIMIGVIDAAHGKQ